MKIYNSYVVIRRYRGNGLTSKAMNLPYASPCRVVVDDGQGYIVCNDRRVCAVDSQTAFEHFAQNDDGLGEVRGALTRKIMARLALDDQLWESVWKSEVCNKYRRQDISDHWVWGYDFFNAPVYDLREIADLVGAK